MVGGHIDESGVQMAAAARVVRIETSKCALQRKLTRAIGGDGNSQVEMMFFHFGQAKRCIFEAELHLAQAISWGPRMQHVRAFSSDMFRDCCFS